MESFNDAWALVCDYCKEKISDVAYKTWFSMLKPVSLDFTEGVAIIEAPNEFHKKTLIKGFTTLLDEAFISVFGMAINYKIVVPEEVLPEEDDKNKLTNEYYDLTFDTFIVGPSNNFAHAACVAVAAKPAYAYNPLFIYGNSGLGKTHLINAIANEISKKNPNANIVYVKGDEFTNEMIESIRLNTNMAFREKYRKADVLLVDDIQFIGGKEATQEEFFHTFNTLYESKKQIILTSDRPPKDIATLEDRLKTRFEWGLTADVQPPDYETRIAIVKRKALSLDIEIPDNVCEFIATKLKSNIRQLEGVVKKIKAYYLLENKEPSIVTAQTAISDIFSDNEPTPITVDKILEEVTRTFGCSKEDILSTKRKSHISNARQVSAYIIREVTQMTMINIGEELGNRDYSTIVYYIQQVESKLNKNNSLKSTVEDIIKNIKNR